MVTSSTVVPAAYAALNREVSIGVPTLNVLCSWGSGRAYSEVAASDRLTSRSQLPPIMAKSMSGMVIWLPITGCWSMDNKLLPQTMEPEASSRIGRAGVMVATTVPWLGSAFTVAATATARLVGHARS